MRPEAVVFAIPGSKLTDAVTVDSREKDKNPENRKQRSDKGQKRVRVVGIAEDDEKPKGAKPVTKKESHQT